MSFTRSDSLQDIDFTLRRQFNKETFRYQSDGYRPNV